MLTKLKSTTSAMGRSTCAGAAESRSKLRDNFGFTVLDPIIDGHLSART